MMLLLELGILLVAGGLFWQDWRARQVSVWLLLVLQLLLVLRFILLALAWEFLLFNVAFIAFQLLALSGYWLLRYRNLKLWQGIGMGDIVFWFIVVWAFSPLNFLGYYVLSLLGGLLLFASWKVVKKGKQAFTMPLAGVQAVFLGCCLLLDRFSSWSATSDEWFNSFLLP